MQNTGIPIGGAMDQAAMQMANSLLNNHKHSAVLEMSFKGPKLFFHQSTTIALAGADMNAKLNEKPINNFTAIKIKENDLLQFGNAHQGKRTYLAVAGGFKNPEILNSRSQYLGITPEATISKTKLIPIDKVDLNLKKGARLTLTESNETDTIPVYKGPEFYLLPKKAQDQLTKQVFTISNKNSRMAYVLVEKLLHELPSIWTAPLLPGTIQCTPDGTLAILMRDAQTTGGYPRVLQVSDEGINRLAQKSTKDQFQFELTSV
jgi:allophanate hydrolase subunit 2